GGAPGRPYPRLTKPKEQEPRERCVAAVRSRTSWPVLRPRVRPAPSSERHRLTPLSERGDVSEARHCGGSMETIVLGNNSHVATLRKDFGLTGPIVSYIPHATDTHMRDMNYEPG